MKSAALHYAIKARAKQAANLLHTNICQSRGSGQAIKQTDPLLLTLLLTVSHGMQANEIPVWEPAFKLLHTHCHWVSIHLIGLCATHYCLVHAKYIQNSYGYLRTFVYVWYKHV